MSTGQSKKTIPKQRKGAKSDTSYSINLKTPEEAKRYFSESKTRLLDVSNWHQLCGLVTATFALTDNSGNKVTRDAREGDYLRIDIPGPGSKTGDGYDWGKIESIETKLNSANDYEELLMRVRPSKNPSANSGQTAHFFKEDASSTFMVIREKNIVTAEIHGRNEVPNTKPEKITDAIRNTLIAIGAMLGFSKAQWKKLVKGLVLKAK